VLRTLSNHKKEKFEQPAEWPDREPPADLLPDAAGMNRFGWDLRVEDPREIPGAFYADEGPRGPVVNPGSYVVRLTTRSAVQSVPLEVVPDPRLKDTVTAGDLAPLGSDDTDDAGYRCAASCGQSDAHHAAQSGDAEGLGGRRGRRQGLSGGGRGFRQAHGTIEEQLIQVNMKASEDNLRYPNRLNEQYDTFIATVDADDVAPTVAQQEYTPTCIDAWSSSSRSGGRSRTLSCRLSTHACRKQVFRGLRSARETDSGAVVLTAMG